MTIGRSCPPDRRIRVATPTSVEEYLAGLPDAARVVLEELRHTPASLVRTIVEARLREVES
jgi:hypothetical protein